MYRIHFEHLYTFPLICYDPLKMASIEVKQISSTHACYRFRGWKIRQSVVVYIRIAHGVFHVCMTWKWAPHACRKNLWMTAKIIWWLFAHFRSQKRAASVGLRHACINVSMGISNTYTTLSLLSRMFSCCKSWPNISSSSCHWALWAALWL